MSSFCYSDFPNLFGGYDDLKIGGKPAARSGSSSSSSSLVLDSERGELVKTSPAAAGKRCAVTAEDKAKAALKSHSEAERRRRERINSHLSTLRGLVPSNDKMDKAALLAEVINQVRELKRNATELSKGYLIPSDVDEVRVESNDCVNQSGFLIKASLCCEDRPELFADLRQSLQALGLRIVRTEISSLAGRIKNVFFIACDGDNDRVYASTVQKALKAVLDKITSQDFAEIGLSNKRRRISLFESVCSSY